jgi:hypothetical protein
MALPEGLLKAYNMSLRLSRLRGTASPSVRTKTPDGGDICIMDSSINPDKCI